MKLSTDWKVLEFNSAAESFFGKTRDHVTGRNYFELFIPEPLKHKAKQQMNKLLNKTGKNNIKLKVIASDAIEYDMEWSVWVHYNHLQKPSEMIIVAKNK